MVFRSRSNERLQCCIHFLLLVVAKGHALNMQSQRRTFGGVGDLLKEMTEPSMKPTMAPSRYPSFTPTLAPSSSPSMTPTSVPSLKPTRTPSHHPSFSPTKKPSSSPSKAPSKTPTLYPTMTPSARPSKAPVYSPTSTPSTQPSTPVPTTATPAPSSSPSITQYEEYIFNLNSEFPNNSGLMTKTQTKSFERATEDFLANSTCISQKLENDPQSVAAKVEDQAMVDSKLRVKVKVNLQVPDRANLNKQGVKQVVVKCVKDNFSDWTDKLELAITSSFSQVQEPDDSTQGNQTLPVHFIILAALTGFAAFAAIAVLFAKRAKSKKLRLMKEKVEEGCNSHQHDISEIELCSENFEPKMKSMSFVTTTDSGNDGTYDRSGDERSQKDLKKEIIAHYEAELLTDSVGQNSPQMISAPLAVNFQDDLLLETRSIPEINQSYTYDEQSTQDDRTQTTSGSSVFGLNISVGALEESKKDSVLNMISTERILLPLDFDIHAPEEGMDYAVSHVDNDSKGNKSNEINKTPMRQFPPTPEKPNEMKVPSFREENVTQASSGIFVISSSSEEENEFFSKKTNLNEIVPENYASWVEKDGNSSI